MIDFQKVYFAKNVMTGREGEMKKILNFVIKALRI